MFSTHREIKMKITTPTVKTTHVPTITPTVIDSLFDDVLSKPVDTAPLSTEKNTIYIIHRKNMRIN